MLRHCLVAALLAALVVEAPVHAVEIVTTEACPDAYDVAPAFSVAHAPQSTHSPCVRATRRRAGLPVLIVSAPGIASEAKHPLASTRREVAFDRAARRRISISRRRRVGRTRLDHADTH